MSHSIDHHRVEHEDPRPWSGAVVQPRASSNSSCASLLLDSDDWRFRLSPRPGPVDFIATDYDDRPWTSIKVPSHWVLQGHGKPYYTNLEYPFVVDPPRVPSDNPTGDYRRTFTLPEDWPKLGSTVVRFDGAESWLKLWVNGVEIGWSTGSRLVVEYDISKALRRDGPNTLCARVIQWSAATYLEDQDQWWLPGIFRSVTLLHRPPAAIHDVFVHADYDHETRMGQLTIDAECESPVEIHVPELDIRAASGETVSLGVLPWTAETPKLYIATVSSKDERVSIKIGFRTVEISEGLLKVNGVPLLLNGVNRHEFHCESGRALDHETMLQDVLMMKRHNINAVRTAHYPPHPHFIELCDEHGLWVVAEGDMETHGFGYVDWRNNPTDSPLWSDAVLNRVQRLVERDKNHASIIIWSIGNESGRGQNIGTLSRWIRERDPDRPIIYENDWTAEHADIWCHMYTWHDEVRRIGRNEESFDGYGYSRGEAASLGAEDRQRLAQRRAGMPFLVIEYGHAMGNGPGGLKEYQELFDEYPRLQGGFIWEWIDHGIKQVQADGQSFYAYGGDFGEERGVHGANFVCDGLCFPDRQPSPALLEVQRHFEPVKLSVDLDQGKRLLTVRNRHAFIDTSYLVFSWQLEVDGRPVSSSELDVPRVPAGAMSTILLPDLADVKEAHDLPPGERCWTVQAALRHDSAWASAGHEIAWTQCVESTDGRSAPTGPAPSPPAVHGNSISIGRAKFDAIYGNLLSIGDVRILKGRLNIWRALTDNDRGDEMTAEWPEVRTNYSAKWLLAGFDRMQERIDAVKVCDNRLIVTSTVGAAIWDRCLRTTYEYSSADGDSLSVDVRILPEGDWSDLPLPRLGMIYELDPAEKFEEASWYGYGPGEAYPDSRAASRLGRYCSTVAAMQTPYIMPQENGSRIDVRTAELLAKSGHGLLVTGHTPFAFTVREWPDEQLESARRLTQLQPGSTTYLYLDRAQSGLGSASTGPGVQEQYRIQLRAGEPISFGFTFHLLD